MSVDRKAVTRAYKETPRTMGVGAVRNTVSGKTLVVASTDLPSRLNRERAQLRLGAHMNRALQRDWAEHGAEAFVFEVLDTLPPPKDPDHDPSGDLAVLETMWLERLAPWEPAGYHRAPGPR